MATHRRAARPAPAARASWQRRIRRTLGLAGDSPTYVKLTGLDDRTATRDLVGAADLGLLEARGERRGRHYVAGAPLRAIRSELRAKREPLTDPYPRLTDEIRRAR